MAHNRDDDWVTAAMTDDSAVADLLTRFRRGPPPRPQPTTKRSSVSSPPLGWTVRQPRSKPAPRASPTTPLSWSGATSASGGSELSSHPPPPELHVAARSKAIATGGVSISKRSRKKKTFPQLKEEEILLEKERKHLKRQLETLRVTLENQRATNENLKRYKVDLQPQTSREKVIVCPCIEAMPNQTQLQNVSLAQTSSSISPEEIRNEENSSENYVLPDLNLPFNEHSNIEVS